MSSETSLSGHFLMDGAREILSRSDNAKFLREQIEALEEAVQERPGIALDLAKSLIETTCKTILEDLGVKIEGSPKTIKLVRKTITKMKMTQEDATREARDGVRDIVSGISTVVNGLCTLRNKEGSASHGRDAFVKTLEPPRAFLAARAADAIVGFLWAVHRGFQEDIVPERIVYEDCNDFNEWIDSQYESAVTIQGISFAQSEILFNTDRKAYKDQLIEFLSNWDGRLESQSENE